MNYPSLARDTFDYLKPSDEQLKTMETLREAARVYAEALDRHLKNGPDKTFVLRSHRTTAMWVNVCVTRQADGSPRAQGAL